MKLCPSCQMSGDFKELSFGGYFYNDKKLPLVLCCNCGLQFILHNLPFEEIASFYMQDEYFGSEYAGGGATDSYEKNITDQYKKASFSLNYIQKYKKRGSILEIGCAGGYFLQLARNKYNYNVKGIEVSKKMSEFGKSELNLDIHCGTIYDAPNSWGKFDIVYMGDVLEHIPNPNNFVLKVKEKMNNNSVLCLELPFTYNWTISGLLGGAFNLLKGRFGKQYFLPAQHRVNFVCKPPYHLLMFTKKSITYFLENNGFKVQYIKVYEGKPKFKFDSRNIYSILKTLSYYFTLYLPQNTLGDRVIVVAQKSNL